MARDVELDVVANDKTAPGTRSVERNMKRAGASAKGLTGQLRRAGDQWSRGFSKLGGAANRWANSGDTAGKKFVRGVAGGVGKLAEIGGSIGGGLSKAVTAAGPQVALAVTAVLAAAAVAAAPAMAGAIVGGAGLGGVVGGLVLAAKDARVASAFDALKEEVGTGLQQAAQAFVPAALESVKEARAAFRGMLPDIQRLFNVTSRWAAPLTRSLGQGAKLALSGIVDAVANAGPIVSAIGDGVKAVGLVIGQVFRDLADDGPALALALRGAFGLITGAIQFAGKALNGLVEAFEWFVRKIPGGKRMLDDMSASQSGAAGSAFNLSHGFKALADDANAAADGMSRAKQKSDEFVDSNIGLMQAQIASREAVRTATAAIKENADAKLTNRQRADANNTALLQLASAFNAEADAGDRSKISAQQAQAAYDRNRASLIKMAMNAGHTKTQAERLATQLLKVPKNVTSKIAVDTAGASSKLGEFTRKVRQLDGTVVNVKARFTSTGDVRVPGGGRHLVQAGYQSWSASDGAGTSRTGGPLRVEASVNQTLNVALDGQPFYAYTERAVRESERRTRWQRRVAPATAGRRP